MKIIIKLSFWDFKIKLLLFSYVIYLASNMVNVYGIDNTSTVPLTVRYKCRKTTVAHFSKPVPASGRRVVPRTWTARNRHVLCPTLNQQISCRNPRETYNRSFPLATLGDMSRKASYSSAKQKNKQRKASYSGGYAI